jgi:hypothetical protein
MSLLTRSLIPALALALLASGPVVARDTKYMVPLQEILDMPEAKEKLDGSVRFYLKGQPAPNVRQRFDEDVSNKKTNGVGKDDLTGCKWAALSALIAFQESAKQKGANAVVDLHSFYKRATVKDPVTYQCHAGAVVIGVTLKGTYAKV